MIFLGKELFRFAELGYIAFLVVSGRLLNS